MCLWECKSTDPSCYVPLSLSVKLEDQEIGSGPTGQVIEGSWTVTYCRWPSFLLACPFGWGANQKTGGQSA